MSAVLWLIRKWFVAPVGGVGRVVAFVVYEVMPCFEQGDGDESWPMPQGYVPVYILDGVEFKMNRAYVGMELGAKILEGCEKGRIVTNIEPTGAGFGRGVIGEDGLSCKYFYFKAKGSGDGDEGLFIVKNEVDFCGGKGVLDGVKRRHSPIPWAPN